jgi:serine protease AprX
MSRAAEDAIRAGIVVVAAVGNTGRDDAHRVVPPASVPAVISVGGFNDGGDPKRGELSTYSSSFGPTVDGLQKPEIIAPAIWIAAPLLPGTPTAAEAALLERLDAADESSLARVLAESTGTSADLDAAASLAPFFLRQLVRSMLHDKKIISGSYQHVDGTSFAAPIVSSVVAQMLEANGELSPNAVKRMLIDTAERLPGVEVDRQGWGVVQPRAAVGRAERSTQRRAGT